MKHNLKTLAAALALGAFAAPSFGQGECVINAADFKKTVLATRVAEPMRMAILPDGRVMYVLKRGRVMIWLPQTQTVEEAGFVPVATPGDEGMHGMAVDPGFAANNFIWLAYDPASNNSQAPTRWVSRFTLAANRLVMSSEKRVLQVQSEADLPQGCCHQGGALAFDNQGNLYFSVGERADYSLGVAPMNEGNRHQNTLRTSGNSNDLRGKVLRIKPKADGSGYDIPEGNLFPKGMDSTRPEIYAMGLRNPFGMHYDTGAGRLFVGDVGMDKYSPDTMKGAVGYDEINMLTKAAHLGYPFVNGPNDPLRNYDYANKVPLEWFDPNHLRNPSKWNTGLKDLTPAGKPLIPLVYYPNQLQYNKDFPDYGSGRMALMAGPTYRYRETPASTVRFPAFLSGRFFFWDNERNWIRAAVLAADGKLVRADKILTGSTWVGITDMEFGPDGALYVLEYGNGGGSGFYTPNPEARLSRVEYTGKACGSVSTQPVPSAPFRPRMARLAYDGAAYGLAVTLPDDAQGFEAFSPSGRRLWRHRRAGASAMRIPAEPLRGQGMVLIRYH